MNPLIVTSFFDIGRGDWEYLQRSSETYLTSFKRYVALLPAKKYILSTEKMRSAVINVVDYFDAAEFADLPAYRYLEATRSIMGCEAFKGLFKDEDRQRHPEHHIPEYNVLMMMKWDALERAAALTKYRFSHYVWADFGLGARGGQRPFLPQPLGLNPIERDQIVLSAQRKWGMANIERDSILKNMRHSRDQACAGVMIIPYKNVDEFCSLARDSYERLLAMGLTSDDQVVVDMCVARRPDLFYLSFPHRGLTKFNHIHNVLNGLDTVQPRAWAIPVWDKLTRGIVRKLTKWRMGL